MPPYGWKNTLLKSVFNTEKFMKKENLSHIYVLPHPLSPQELTDIWNSFVENGKNENAVYKVLSTKEKKHYSKGRVSFIWDTTSDYGGVTTPYTNRVAQLYDIIRYGKIELKASGVLKWSVDVPPNLTNKEKNLFYTMMYKPLWNFGLLNKLETLMGSKFPDCQNISIMREIWPMQEYSNSDKKEDDAIMGALIDWVAQGTFWLNPHTLAGYESINNAKALLKTYQLRLSQLLEVGINEKAQILLNEYQLREIWIDNIEKEKFYNTIKNTIIDTIMYRDVLGREDNE